MQFDRLKRREFITLLGGAAAVWPFAARAQQAVPVIGFLGASTPLFESQRVIPFVQRLRELGWIEGLEYRWSEGRSERFTEIAAEFVQLKVDVIVATGGAIRAAKQATSVIPIVFPVAGDPVRAGYVDSLARPGGNVTGLSAQQTDLASKRLELLREVVPGLRRLAIMTNAGNTAAALEARDVEDAATTLGFEATILEIHLAQDIVPAFEAVKGRSDAIYVVAEPLVFTNRARIHTLAMAARLPVIYSSGEYVEAGGLMSYGPNLPDFFRRAADIVDKILHGAKPAGIPVQQPTKFDLVVNLTTAKALGLTVPDKLLALADEVIE
jgi:putative ABC transport system substrate-binding protein